MKSCIFFFHLFVHFGSEADLEAVNFSPSKMTTVVPEIHKFSNLKISTLGVENYALLFHSLH